MRLAILTLVVACVVPVTGTPRPLATARHAAVQLRTTCVTARLTGARAEAAFDIAASNATGVVIGRRQILTARHVIACPALTYVVAITDDDRRVAAFVDRQDPELDLARLSTNVDVFDVTPPMIRATAIGDRACAFVECPGTAMTCGDVTASGTGAKGIAIDALTDFGNSGSGVYVGEALVGIITHRAAARMTGLASPLAGVHTEWFQ